MPPWGVGIVPGAGRVSTLGLSLRSAGSLSVDHIVPTARGGAALDRSNTQPMHLACNSSKVRQRRRKIYRQVPQGFTYLVSSPRLHSASTTHALFQMTYACSHACTKQSRCNTNPLHHNYNTSILLQTKLFLCNKYTQPNTSILL